MGLLFHCAFIGLLLLLIYLYLKNWSIYINIHILHIYTLYVKLNCALSLSLSLSHCVYGNQVSWKAGHVNSETGPKASYPFKADHRGTGVSSPVDFLYSVAAYWRLAMENWYMVSAPHPLRPVLCGIVRHVAYSVAYYRLSFICKEIITKETSQGLRKVITDFTTSSWQDVPRATRHL